MPRSAAHSSYVGPARLVVAGTVHDVAVNLHAFVDLTEPSPPPADTWRGVVVDAAFVPPSDEPVPAEVRLPDGRGVQGTLRARRLEGRGPA
jgi:hypothetical protein